MRLPLSLLLVQFLMLPSQSFLLLITLSRTVVLLWGWYKGLNRTIPTFLVFLMYDNSVPLHRLCGFAARYTEVGKQCVDIGTS